MRMFARKRAGLGLLLVPICTGLLMTPGTAALAQEEGPVEEVTVTGSRIRQQPIDSPAPVLNISSEDLDRSGLTSIGDFLQRLSVGGAPLNTRFNSSGNFGFPPDGTGIGAGSSQVDLRYLGSKRVLVLVDGVRWVAGASASGVAAATDLNTIPLSIVDRIEVLEDGASTIYGSDAISGVVNIITKKSYDGIGANAYWGTYSEDGGATQEFDITLGATQDKTSVFFNISYVDQGEMSAGNVDQASESAGPGTTNRHGSSGTPQGRFVFTDPNTNTLINCTTPPGTGALVYDPMNPCMGDSFDPWDNGDRFNFAPFNLVLTPSERWSIYGQASHQITDNVSFNLKGLYNNRESVNQAAPEPLFIGPEAGNGNRMDLISIDVTNPYNPFGFTIDNATNFQGGFIGRRPLEGGPRLFRQDVDTWYLSGGFEGSFEWADRTFFWDTTVAWANNRADQIKMGGYNSRNIELALGPVADCNADLNCVPLNIFGGQGPNGAGTITPEMLDYISFTQQDSSENELVDIVANITGDIVDLPAGPLGFAFGYEHREQDGFFQPDAVVVAGDSAGLPALPTSGGFDVDEFYGELAIPIFADRPGAELLDLSIAARNSDYSTFGSETTTKFGLRYKPTSDFLIRGSVAEGFRAPSIAELFGSQTRFDATIEDPCSDFLNSGVPQNVIDNCVNVEGVPADGSYVQSGGQISVLTGGNQDLEPETADSISAGFVYSPSWVENTTWAEQIDVEFTYYDHDIDDAITAVDAQTVLNSCAATGDPASCDLTGRTPSGTINRFDNQLVNIGGIETSGYDVNVTWIGPEFGIGQFSVSWFNTFVDDFTEIIPTSTGFQDRELEGREDNDKGIPEWKSTLIIDYLNQDWSGSWTIRHISDLTEPCSDFLDNTPDSLTALGVCSDPVPVLGMNEAMSENKLGSTTYHDLQVTWTPSQWEGVAISAGINNILDKSPPACYSCSLNGYDPSTYDIPGRFGYIRASMEFGNE